MRSSSATDPSNSTARPSWTAADHTVHCGPIHVYTGVDDTLDPDCRTCPAHNGTLSDNPARPE
ncbi:hypothetical protein Misp05_12690 [Micromonospora sp. NBRC 107095]|nr:hypothetical protein Misp05_12690 [Micromonospora sp. NBRC 107095]